MSPHVGGWTEDREVEYRQNLEQRRLGELAEEAAHAGERRSKAALARRRRIREVPGTDATTAQWLEDGFSEHARTRRVLDEMDAETEREHPGWVPPYKRPLCCLHYRPAKNVGTRAEMGWPE